MTCPACIRVEVGHRLRGKRAMPSGRRRCCRESIDAHIRGTSRPRGISSSGHCGTGAENVTMRVRSHANARRTRLMNCLTDGSLRRPPAGVLTRNVVSHFADDPVMAGVALLLRRAELELANERGRCRGSFWRPSAPSCGCRADRIRSRPCRAPRVAAIAGDVVPASSAPRPASRSRASPRTRCSGPRPSASPARGPGTRTARRPEFGM